jgi:hypothetical protein
VEPRGGTDQSWLLLQGSTPSELHLLQVVDGGEMLVDEHRVGQGPPVFGRLEFGRIGMISCWLDIAQPASQVYDVRQQAANAMDDVLRGRWSTADTATDAVDQ